MFQDSFHLFWSCLSTVLVTGLPSSASWQDLKVSARSLSHRILDYLVLSYCHSLCQSLLFLVVAFHFIT